MNTKKILRTLQVHFSVLQNPLYSLRRFFRKINNSPFEDDFRALRLFPDSARASEMFLDVGSNRGQSIDAIRMYRKNSQIIAFEPNEFLYQKLLKIYQGDKRILIHNFGLGDSDDELTLYIPFYKKWMFDGLASLYRKEAKDFLKNLDQIYFYDDRFLSLQETKIRVRKLDEFKLSPFFIKIDVQGYELQVLRGGEKTLRTHEPILLIEWPENEVINFLMELGYQFYRFEKNKFIANTRGSLNTFFMTKNKFDTIGVATQNKNHFDPKSRRF